MPTIEERLRNRHNTLNTPMACPDCGSTFFLSDHARQYSGAGYGTVEFRDLSITPMQVRVCLCGKVIPPSPDGNLLRGAAGTEREAFYQSIQLADEARAKRDPKKLLDAVAAKRELDDALARLDELSKRLEEMQARLQEHLAQPEAPAETTQTRKKGK